MNLESTEKSQRDTGMAISLLLLLVGLYQEEKYYLIGTGLLLVLTMTIPQVLKYPSILWFGLSEVLGKIVSKVILILVFFLLITPMALLMRVFGKDQLNLKGYNRSTAFRDRMKEYSVQDLKNPF